MPLVSAGQRPIFVGDDTVLAAFSDTNTDFRQIVYLPPEARGAISAKRQTAARVLATKFADQEITLRCDAPATSLVVVSQTYYPAWKGYVDGQPAKIWRANYAFQALQVPAGRHSVQLIYKDRAFLAGAIFSGLGLLSCAGLWWAARSRITAAASPPGTVLQTPAASGRV
jgi:hypothetical protein